MVEKKFPAYNSGEVNFYCYSNDRSVLNDFARIFNR